MGQINTVNGLTAQSAVSADAYKKQMKKTEESDTAPERKENSDELKKKDKTNRGTARNGIYAAPPYPYMFHRKKQISYSPLKDLARIAGANNTRELYRIKSSIRSQIQSAASSNGEPYKVSAMIKKMEKVIGKASIKIRRLNVEMRLEKKRKKAEKLHHEKAERKLKEELIRRKRNRKLHEAHDIANADKDSFINIEDTDNIYIPPSAIPDIALSSMTGGTVTDAAAADCAAAEIGASLDITL